MAKLRISLAQMTVTSGNERKNGEVMQGMVEEAVRRGSQLVVLPEMWSSGYAMEKWYDLAAPLNAGVFAQTSTAAQQQRICVLGSMPEKRGTGVSDSAAFFSPNGSILGVYRKIHLFKPMGEDRHLIAGRAPLNIDLPWGKTGIAICYDLRFPELFRRYGVDRAVLVLVPSAWPLARIEHWRTLLKARAIENQYFVVGCNCVGEAQTDEGQTVFGGHSAIIDPWGETVLEAGTMPGLYTTDIELDLVSQVRQRIPVLEDRRPDTYGLDDIMSQLDFGK
ncbi:MAG: carbon-nitrogen family hydrolase [Anaerolineae bacterium]|nr:carbon-nitrogen family hydrolase [Anaerolineae bacterium]